MDPVHIILLVSAGLAGGFIAGLVGVGGGVIFSPVLFIFYSEIGTDPALVPPLTLGSSLLCTMLAAAGGAQRQWREGAIQLRMAGVVGAFAAVAVTATTFLVTTRPWYSAQIFQIVLAVVLLAVVWRMLTGTPVSEARSENGTGRVGMVPLAGSGLAAGAVASAAGVGGGIVMVPMFNQLMRIPLKIATATSIATIVVISGTGVITYILSGLAVDTPATALGYVDFGRALWLGIPAIAAARVGVMVAVRSNVMVVRYAFSALAALIAVRLLGSSLGLF